MAGWDMGLHQVIANARLAVRRSETVRRAMRRRDALLSEIAVRSWRGFLPGPRYPLGSGRRV